MVTCSYWPESIEHLFVGHISVSYMITVCIGGDWIIRNHLKNFLSWSLNTIHTIGYLVKKKKKYERCHCRRSSQTSNANIVKKEGEEANKSNAPEFKYVLNSMDSRLRSIFHLKYFSTDSEQKESKHFVSSY